MYVEFRMKKIFIILNLILMFILCIIIYSIFNNYTFIKNITKIEVNTLKDSYQVECYLGLLDNNPDISSKTQEYKITANQYNLITNIESNLTITYKDKEKYLSQKNIYNMQNNSDSKIYFIDDNSAIMFSDNIKNEDDIPVLNYIKNLSDYNCQFKY
jgi:hypothetical protein